MSSAVTGAITSLTLGRFLPSGLQYIAYETGYVGLNRLVRRLRGDTQIPPIEFNLCE